MAVHAGAGQLPAADLAALHAGRPCHHSPVGRDVPGPQPEGLGAAQSGERDGDDDRPVAQTGRRRRDGASRRRSPAASRPFGIGCAWRGRSTSSAGFGPTHTPTRPA